jgi:hypothetical protein
MIIQLPQVWADTSQYAVVAHWQTPEVHWRLLAVIHWVVVTQAVL